MTGNKDACSHLAVRLKTGEFVCVCEQDYAASCMKDGCPLRDHE